MSDRKRDSSPKRSFPHSEKKKSERTSLSVLNTFFESSPDIVKTVSRTTAAVTLDNNWESQLYGGLFNHGQLSNCNIQVQCPSIIKDRLLANYSNSDFKDWMEKSRMWNDILFQTTNSVDALRQLREVITENQVNFQLRRNDLVIEQLQDILARKLHQRRLLKEGMWKLSNWSLVYFGAVLNCNTPILEALHWRWPGQRAA